MSDMTTVPPVVSLPALTLVSSVTVPTGMVGTRTAESLVPCMVTVTLDVVPSIDLTEKVSVRV